MRFMYTIKSTISYTGLAEIVFKVDSLKAVGGFSIKFAIGDIYIKKKLCLTEDVLFVPRGFAFWRHSPNQASKVAEKSYGKLIEEIQIDREIIFDPSFPVGKNEKEIIIKNIQIREVKVLIMNTLRKFKVIDFFRVRKLLNIPYSQFKYIFEKASTEYYLFTSEAKEVLKNHFNFNK